MHSCACVWRRWYRHHWPCFSTFWHDTHKIHTTLCAHVYTHRVYYIPIILFFIFDTHWWYSSHINTQSWPANDHSHISHAHTVTDQTHTHTHVVINLRFHLICTFECLTKNVFFFYVFKLLFVTLWLWQWERHTVMMKIMISWGYTTDGISGRNVGRFDLISLDAIALEI